MSFDPLRGAGASARIDTDKVEELNEKRRHRLRGHKQLRLRKEQVVKKQRFIIIVYNSFNA